MGGVRTLDLPLYREGVGVNGQPLWEQDEQHVENCALNSIGIFLPQWHDMVRIELPADFTPASTQVIDIERFALAPALPGETLYVIGFPHGYSAYGEAAPVPVTLVRHLASQGNAEFLHESLLDSACAPSMSGAPVFADLEQEMKAVGIYVGSVYTDRSAVGDRQFSLGRMTPFSFLQNVPLVPSLAVAAPRI